MLSNPMVVDVSQDWAVACDLQQRSMEAPRPKVQRLAYSARCRQMRALGGDAFTFLPLPGRRIALAVADASGKGLPAALIMANAQSSLRTAALFAPGDAAAVATAVNRQLHACSPADRFATLFYAVFEEDSRRLRYVNAGHNPAVVLREWVPAAWLEASAPPLGLFAETACETRTVQLQRGDLILAYTDGVVEATNAANQEWGVRGLLAAVAAHKRQPPAGIVEAAFAALDRFSEDRQSDDATILAALVN